MPVTATLSRKFYEKFGDDLTNELVNWLNQVDAAYRSDLRELNEVNFARFDAKLEQRATQLDPPVIAHENTVRLPFLGVRAASLTRSAVVHVPTTAGAVVKDESAVDRALGAGSCAAVSGEPGAALMSYRLIDKTAEDFGVGRELQIWQLALASPVRGVRVTTDVEDNDADPSMLGARDEEIGAVGLDRPVGDDDQQGKDPCERVLGTFVRLREHRLELRQLHEHAE